MVNTYIPASLGDDAHASSGMKVVLFTWTSSQWLRTRAGQQARWQEACNHCLEGSDDVARSPINPTTSTEDRDW